MSGEELLADVAASTGIDVDGGTEDDLASPIPGVPPSWVPAWGDSEDAEAPTPSLLEVGEDLFLFYEGFVNGLYGASETFKTWLALKAVRETLVRDGRVLFVDFEQSRDSVLSRLHQMGLAGDVLENFGYISPTEPLPPLQSEEHGLLMKALREYLDGGLAVVDGTTEAMGLHDLDVISNKDVTRFEHLLLKPLVVDDATVILIHHIGNTERDRALGAQQFKSMIGGAAYITDNATPPTATAEGTARLRIHKDRHGGIRSRLNGDNVGTLHFNPHGPLTLVEVNIHWYTSSGKQIDERVAHAIWETANRHYLETGRGLTKTQLETRTKGKAATKRHAIAFLARRDALATGEAYRGRQTWMPGSVSVDEALKRATGDGGSELQASPGAQGEIGEEVEWTG